MNTNSISRMGLLVGFALVFATGGCTSERTKTCNEGHAKYVEGKAAIDPDAEKALSACDGSCFSAKEDDACAKYKALFELLHPGSTPREPPK